MTLLAGDIAFLQKWSAFQITLMCIAPALVFMLYVLWDDARQARAHRREQSKSGPPHP